MPHHIWIFGDTVGRGRCSAPECGAVITWAEVVESRRKMCFNGVLVALRTSQEHGRTTWEVDLETNHWATCPARDRFRRAKS